MIANPRFDPVRTAAELGSTTVADSGYASSTVPGRQYIWWDELPWKRICLVAISVWIVWKLAK